MEYITFAELVFIGVIFIMGFFAWLSYRDVKNPLDSMDESIDWEKPSSTDAPSAVDDAATAKAESAAKKPTKAKLEKMTKVQIEEHARDFGIELDRRKTKANMINDFLGQLKRK